MTVLAADGLMSARRELGGERWAATTAGRGEFLGEAGAAGACPPSNPNSAHHPGRFVWAGLT